MFCLLWLIFKYHSIEKNRPLRLLNIITKAENILSAPSWISKTAKTFLQEYLYCYNKLAINQLPYSNYGKYTSTKFHLKRNKVKYRMNHRFPQGNRGGGNGGQWNYYMKLTFYFLLISFRYANNTGADEAQNLSLKGRLRLRRMKGERE